MAVMAVLIAVIKLVSLGSKSSSVRISVGAGRVASCDVSCFRNLSQSICRFSLINTWVCSSRPCSFLLLLGNRAPLSFVPDHRRNLVHK